MDGPSDTPLMKWRVRIEILFVAIEPRLGGHLQFDFKVAIKQSDRSKGWSIQLVNDPHFDCNVAVKRERQLKKWSFIWLHNEKTQME